MPLRHRILAEAFLVLVGLFYVAFGGYAMLELASDHGIPWSSKVQFLLAFGLLPAAGGMICCPLIGNWVREWTAHRALQRLPDVFE